MNNSLFHRVNKKIQLFFIKRRPRRIPGIFNYYGKNIYYACPRSFYNLYKEIFLKNVYLIKTKNEDIKIIDCGANIGLSTIYFKLRFPKAKVIAFEPDEELFGLLSKNMKSFGFEGVDIQKKGVWKETGSIGFEPEGTDSGRINDVSDKKIEVVKLSSFINEPVDLLKIDIEGAETCVLEEIEHKLSFVKNIFVEYHSFRGQLQTLQVVLDILSRKGFRYYLSNDGVKTYLPFINIIQHKGMDLQVGIYGYRDQN